ncbi:hypothetical protein A2U01_0115216, partial [Trifolium medium]|nr:hypothetical protein [Trifolium medium]
FFLQADAQDRWKWYYDPDKRYSVSGAYHLLTHLVPPAVAADNEIIWNNIAPLDNRLSSKDNM